MLYMNLTLGAIYLEGSADGLGQCPDRRKAAGLRCEAETLLAAG